MSNRDFAEVVELIRKENPRFDKGAFYFVKQALDHTLKSVKKEGESRVGRHVSGQELLKGIREFALEQYGPMTYTLLDRWGVKGCEDFGDIVFLLVDYGVLGKTDHDRREDFAGGYDFREAFVRPFQPAKAAGVVSRMELREPGD
jgi:uncharacterized repeat protein (TIGR04138 family)